MLTAVLYAMHAAATYALAAAGAALHGVAYLVAVVQVIAVASILALIAGANVGAAYSGWRGRRRAVGVAYRIVRAQLALQRRRQQRTR